jgi:hypothetical protein
MMAHASPPAVSTARLQQATVHARLLSILGLLSVLAAAADAAQPERHVGSHDDLVFAIASASSRLVLAQATRAYRGGYRCDDSPGAQGCHAISAAAHGMWQLRQASGQTAGSRRLPRWRTTRTRCPVCSVQDAHHDR